MRTTVAIILAFGAIILWSLWEEIDPVALILPEQEIVPDWSAIAAWPNVESAQVEAVPDPNRQITAIIIDDSGSMSSEIEIAKQAVVGALAPMDDNDRVAVLALNKGVVLDFMSVSDARAALGAQIAQVRSNGTTPLTGAVERAAEMLETEAAKARAFGTYRMIVTTDGQADAPEDLRLAIEQLARVTPIQIATIGIDISGRHVLRRPSLGSFVDITNAAALGGALTKAVAESNAFDAITTFEDN